MKYKRLGLEVPSMLERRYKFWDKRLFYPLKKAIGIPNPNMFPTAGAPLSNRICEFMHSVGINVVVGYGLSETTATVTCFPRIGFEIGTVGTPLPEIDVKIAENGEILVKAPTVTSGYFKNDEANKAAFTADGYFRTGDAGYLDDKGALVLTERIKDLFKTSNGKYIAPQVLESVLVADKYIDEVVVIGENRKYVSALIVPNYHYLKKWAEDKKIQYNSIEELISNPKVVDMVMQHVNSMQAHMAPFEQIKRIKLLPNHFSVMNGEVTNTMKVRRPVVAKRYASEIESLYEN
jgi:long-chain acyl-CoA synthetase